MPFEYYYYYQCTLWTKHSSYFNPVTQVLLKATFFLYLFCCFKYY
jgi:hypothetical protein